MFVYSVVCIVAEAFDPVSFHSSKSDRKWIIGKWIEPRRPKNTKKKSRNENEGKGKPERRAPGERKERSAGT